MVSHIQPVKGIFPHSGIMASLSTKQHGEVACTNAGLGKGLTLIPVHTRLIYSSQHESHSYKPNAAKYHIQRALINKKG